jgi:hypothetical protein
VTQSAPLLTTRLPDLAKGACLALDLIGKSVGRQVLCQASITFTRSTSAAASEQARNS